MPGVVSASLAFSIPPTEWPGAVSIFHPGQEPSPAELQGHEFEMGLRVNINHISPNYFRTLRIPLLAGRDFTNRDRVGAPGVVIVSHQVAQKMWPGENPVGQRIAYPQWAGPRRPPFEVIGVARDVRHLALTSQAPLLMYVPLAQEYDGRVRVVVRTASGNRDGIAMIQRAVAATDKNVAVYAAETGPQHSADSRTREVGIRIALGANRSSVAALVIKQGLLLAAAGILLGLPAAVGFNSLVRRYLAGIDGSDPGGLAAISIFLVVVMLSACWIPARRASRIDPMQALRSE